MAIIAVAERRGEQDGEQQGGEPVEDVGQPQRQLADPAARHAREHPERDADDGRAHHREDADEQADPRAAHDPRQHVGAEAVGAEQVRPAGRRQEVVADGGGIERRPHPTEQREHHDEADAGDAQVQRPAPHVASALRRIRGSTSW
jgi:hypothetical protein